MRCNDDVTCPSRFVQWLVAPGSIFTAILTSISYPDAHCSADISLLTLAAFEFRSGNRKFNNARSLKLPILLDSQATQCIFIL